MDDSICIPIFDDLQSYVHFTLGFVSSSMKDRKVAILISLGFIGYQLGECESLENKIGDFGEFGLGYLTGLLYVNKNYT